MYPRNAVMQTSVVGDAIAMTCKASEAISFGDVVVIGTQDTGPYLVVDQSDADDTTVIGVCSQPGGIASGATGAVTVYGLATVNVASAVYNTVGAILNTNGGGAGTAANGTWAAGKGVGQVAVAGGVGAVTTITAFVRPT